MRRPMVAGNWKMNGSRAMVDELIDQVTRGLVDHRTETGADVLVCPPFAFLERSCGLLTDTPIALGAQNLDTHETGAFTGEISAGMLKDVGCDYVIVGHSERRALYGESDEIVGEKAKAAFSQGLKPIVCLGETQKEREEGVTDKVVTRQFRAVLDQAGGEIFPDAVIAYEPVWAIGTGLTASEAQAQEVHALIRGLLLEISAAVAGSTRILYGGSVKPDNAAGLFAQPDIDGGLIGGASLKATDFLGIISAAS